MCSWLSEFDCKSDQSTLAAAKNVSWEAISTSEYVLKAHQCSVELSPETEKYCETETSGLRQTKTSDVVKWFTEMSDV